MKPYIKIEIKLTYVDPDRWIGKQHSLGNTTVISTVKELPKISETLLELNHSHGLRPLEIEEPKALTEKKYEWTDSCS